MKKWILGIFVIVVLAIIILASKDKSSNDIAEAETVKIGLVAPLSGDAASYGEPVIEGVQLAIEELNNRENAKYKYELIAEDGKCTGASAATVAQKLVNVDKVSYIIGGSCSGENLAMAPITEPAKVLVISPFASSPDITKAGPYTYRTAPSDTESGVFIGNYLKEKYAKVAILSERTDYAQALGVQAKTVFESLGGEVVIDETFQSADEDFRAQVLKVKNSDAEVVFINPQSESNLLGILRQLGEQGVKLPTVGFFLTSDAVATNPYAKDITMFDVPNVANEGKGAIFTGAFSKKFGKNPSYPFAAAGAYDDMYMIAQGIEKNGNTSDDVRKYLDGIKSYEGASGTFRFDENGDPKGYEYIVKKVQGGKFVAAE